MKRVELDEKETKVLSALSNRGAMSPSQVAAETWLLPAEMKTVLSELIDAGYVLMREDSNSPDGWLIAITTQAPSFLNRGPGR